MSSHIPLALSILGTLASHYPLGGSQKAPPPNPPAAPAAAPPAAPPPSVHGSGAAAQPTTGSTAPPKPSNGSIASNNGTNSIPGSLNAVNPVALCDYCQLRPKHFDGTKTHPYCGKTCANKKLNGVAPSNGQITTGSGNTQSANCQFCHNRPKFSDGNKTHDYCSKACARSANGPQRRGTNGGSSNGRSASHSPVPTSQQASSTAVCQAPGCQNPPHSAGQDYCSIAHKTLGETLCLMCLLAPKMANCHFCSQTCIDDAESKGPMILEVPQGHVTFKSVAEQFKASWRHTGSSCPPVKRVYKIVTPASSLASYNAYRAAVEARGQFVSSGRSAGNENRRWHGTKRSCNLGDKGHTQFCSNTGCSLCSIMRSSFDISLWGKKTGWGRFGKGIYTSSTSSKSNDYSQNDCKSSLKAILLNKVVVGKGCKLLQDNTTLTAPPSGFDSVLAEKGGSLNYDELVVYNNDAIRPSFLVMYEP